MRCIYCYEKDKTSTYEWGDIKKLIDDIVRYNSDFNLEFLGGEPCLRIDLIYQTVEYLNSMGDITVGNFAITTNGTIIDDTLIDILKKNRNVTWHASIDGNEFMNSLRLMKSGKNSYSIVIENFKELKRALDSDRHGQLACHIVTHPYNIGYFNDGITDLYKQGFRGFGIGTVESTIIIDEQYCKEFIRQHQILSDRIKAGELPGISIGLFDELKPKSDSRHYIRDYTGKVILETYGRAEGDIKNTEKYRTDPATSSLGDTIYNIRKAVYDYHNR
jgi:sulfatase maturation enzyme AslB (radical SAM superfamily)